MCIGVLRGQKRTSELLELISWRRLWPSHNIVLGSSPDSLQDGLVTLAIKPAPAPELDLKIPPLSAAPFLVATPHFLVATPPLPGGHTPVCWWSHPHFLVATPHSLVATPPFQTLEFGFGFLHHFQSLGNLACLLLLCLCVIHTSACFFYGL